ncbi:MAG: GyrI-like domain-containing protein [Chitinivibrionales bacterium]
MRTIGSIIIVLFVIFLGASFYAGMFDKLSLEIAEAGPYPIVYREHKGPYDGVRFALHDVYRYLKTRRMQWTSKGIGIFYDGQQNVKPQDLRSIAGCVTDTLLTNLDAPYKSQVLPKTRAIVGTFRVRSFLSNFTGTEKFYSVKDLFAKKNGLQLAGPVIELYDMGARRIYYIAPVQ